jgi:hypothetical protein
MSGLVVLLRKSIIAIAIMVTNAITTIKAQSRDQIEVHHGCFEEALSDDEAMAAFSSNDRWAAKNRLTISSLN